MRSLLLVALSWTALLAQAGPSGFGSISGRVLSRDGVPVRDARIGVYYSVNRDEKRPIEVAKSGKTDERGEYRIEEVSPGRYFVSAAPPQSLLQQDPSYRHTYYPGEITFGAANAVELRANGALRGIDLRLRASPGVAVSGTVQRPPVATPETATKKMLDMRLEADHPFMDILASAQSSDRFEFASVPPGRYVLDTWSDEEDERGRRSTFDSRQILVVGTSDLTGVVVKVNPTRGFAGKVVSATGEGIRSITINILGRTRGAHDLGSEDGSFNIPGLPAGLYRVSSGFPSLCSFRSVRLGEVEVGEGEFEFTGTNGPLLITANPGCSSIQRRLVLGR
jgi:hypothetical protein